jgi:hypothetical protein
MQRPEYPYIIDIEASGLGAGSYPIEIGLALGPDQRYCSLIRPAKDWDHWDSKAEQVHQIKRETLLDAGRPVTEVALELNQLLSGRVVYSDAWGVDNPWVIELFVKAGIYQEFTVSALEMILSEEQVDIWGQTRDEVVDDLGLRRHRASNDSWILQETYRRTLKKTS